MALDAGCLHVKQAGVMEEPPPPPAPAPMPALVGRPASGGGGLLRLRRYGTSQPQQLPVWHVPPTYAVYVPDAICATAESLL